MFKADRAGDPHRVCDGSGACRLSYLCRAYRMCYLLGMGAVCYICVICVVCVSHIRSY